MVTSRFSRGALVAPALLLIAAAFSGCATTERVALAPATAAQIKSTEALLNVHQKELATEITPSNTGAVGAQFGLIGGLVTGIIDSSVNNNRAKNATNTVGPVRDALIDYDLHLRTKEMFEKELAAAAWFQPAELTRRELGSPKELKKVIQDSASETVLIVNAHYALTPDFRQLRMTATVRLYPKAKALFSLAQTKPLLPAPALYAGTFTTTYPAPDCSGKDIAACALIWAMEEGKEAKAALDQASAEIARMVAWDLVQAQDDGKLPKGATRYGVPASAFAFGERPIAGLVYQGYAVNHAPGRVWVRLNTGALASLPE